MVSVAKTAMVISGNASGFSAAVTQAERDAQKLIISLQTQADKANLVGRSFDAYQLALAGASSAAVQQIEQLQKQLQEQDQHNAAMQRAAQITESVMTAEEKHSRTLSELNAQLKSGGITVETYDRALRSARDTLARANGVSDEAKAAAKRQADAEQQRAQQMQRAAQLTDQVRTPTERYKQALAELNQHFTSGRISAETYHRQIQAMNNNMQNAKAAQEQFRAGTGNAMFAVQQLAFGLQDAASVYGQMGFSGAVRAASNNIVQFASLTGPVQGVVTALAMTGLQLGIDYFSKFGDEVKKAGDQLQEFQFLSEGANVRISEFKRERDLNKEVQNANSTDQIKSLREKHQDRRKELQMEIAEETKQQESLAFGTVKDVFGNGIRVRRATSAAEQEALRLQYGEQAPEMMNEKAIEQHKKLEDSIRKKRREQVDLQRQDQRLAQREMEVGMEEESHEQEKRQKKRDEEAKKAEEDAKRRAKEIHALEKSLRKDDTSTEGKARGIVEELKERDEKLSELFPDANDPKRKMLFGMSVDAANQDLDQLQQSLKKKSLPMQFAGAAGKDSREAYSTMLQNRFGQMQTKGIDPAQQKIIDAHKQEVKLLEDLKKNTAQQPQVVKLSP